MVFNIVHYLTVCTVYISVAPDAMHHVKTYRDDLKNMHCVAPEYGGKFNLWNIPPDEHFNGIT